MNKHILSQQPEKSNTNENNKKNVPNIINNSSLQTQNIKNEYVLLSFKDKLQLAQDNSKMDLKTQQESKNHEIMNNNNKSNEVNSQIEINKNILDEEITRRNKNEINELENKKTDKLSFKEKLQIDQAKSSCQEPNNEQINNTTLKIKSSDYNIKPTKEQIKNIQNNDSKSINNNDINNSEPVENINNETKNKTTELSFKEKLRLAREYSQTLPTNKINTINDINQSCNSKVIDNFDKQLNENKERQNTSPTPNKLDNGKSTSSNFKELLKLAQKKP